MPIPPPMTRRTSGFWSKGKIEAELDRWNQAGLPLIKPAPVQIGAASCRLTVGDQIYISPAKDDDLKTRRMLRKNEACVIPPGQFAFLTTAETVRVPMEAIAFITLRTKMASFRGLVNVSGFHVDPGYTGRLIFSVFNAGPGPIQVIRGEPWFEIFFADLSGPSAHDVSQEKIGYDGIESRLITPLSDQFYSFAGLDEQIKENKKDLETRLHTLEREQAVLRWAALLVAGALLTVALRPAWDRQPRAEQPLTGVTAGATLPDQSNPGG